MNKKSFLSMISISRKAGRFSFGSDCVEKDIIKGRSFLVIVASNTSEKTVKKVSLLCEEKCVKIISPDITKEEIGDAIGKKPIAVASVTDINLASALIKLTEVL